MEWTEDTGCPVERITFASSWREILYEWVLTKPGQRAIILRLTISALQRHAGVVQW